MCQPKSSDYTKIYWVEAFANIMGEPESKELPPEEFYFYSRALVSHTLANNVLKDSLLSNESHVTELIDDFYEAYKKNRQTDKNGLLTTLFMKTLVDIDENRIRLRPIDKQYLTEINLPNTLEIKKCVPMLDDEAKNRWLTHYMYAKTAPEVISGNVELYQCLGKDNYNSYVEREKYISSGPDALSKEVSEFFSTGMYTLYNRSEFPLEDIVRLRKTMKKPSQIVDVPPRVGYIYFQYRLAQNALPEDSRELYWKTKISNFKTFIEQASRTSQIAAKT